jgi:hypothetical protein
LATEFFQVEMGRVWKPVIRFGVSRMNSLLVYLYFFICISTANLLNRPRFNIEDYGAIGDGKTLNTKAIKAAAKAASNAGNPQTPNKRK